MLSSRGSHCSPFDESLGVYVGESVIAKDTENSGFSASPTLGCLRPPTLTISSSWLPWEVGSHLVRCLSAHWTLSWDVWPGKRTPLLESFYVLQTHRAASDWDTPDPKQRFLQVAVGFSAQPSSGSNHAGLSWVSGQVTLRNHCSPCRS